MEGNVTKTATLRPIDNFKNLDGCHCQTNSFAKIYDFHNKPLSEDMLFGVGSGLGFMYWHQKGIPPFMGGRDNQKNFHNNIGERTGVRIERVTTASNKKAEEILIKSLNSSEPLMIHVDMGFIPCYGFPEGYHFGGHTVVVSGYDGEDKVLVSDMEPKDRSRLKKGFAYEMSLQELAKARGSKFKPFPPANAYYTFNFNSFREPTKKDILASIKQTVGQMLKPPIKNFGIKGIRKAAVEIPKWEEQFEDKDLRMSIFNIHISVTVGGTGGGLFRYMYSRFLSEASKKLANKELSKIAGLVYEAGDLWTNMSAPLEDAINVKNPASLLKGIPEQLTKIAEVEEQAFNKLMHL